MGKLSVKHSSGNVPKTVLDLGTESFSAACRNGSGNEFIIKSNINYYVIDFQLKMHWLKRMIK